MEEREEIKLKILLLVILSIPIAISFWFILSVNKVYAATSIKAYNSNGADLIDCYNCNSLTGNRSYVDFNYDFDYQQSTNLNIQFNNIITINRVGGNLNIPAPTIIVANGYLTYDIGSYCTNVVSNRTDTTGNLFDTTTINYAYTCDIPNYSGNFPNYRSLKVTYNKTYTGQIIGQTSYDNGFQVIETAYNPNPQTPDYTGTINSVGGNIINNNNQNTESIINNNNSNTQSIIDNQNANSKAQIDKIDETYNTCESIYPSSLTNKGYIDSSGNYIYEETGNSKASNYIKTENKKFKLVNKNTSGNYRLCEYGYRKEYITCRIIRNMEIGEIQLNASTFYIRFSGNEQIELPIISICYNRLEGNTAPNESKYNDEKEQEYLEKEEDLLDLYNSDQLDIIDLTIDTNGSNWVWDRITQFLNTNQYIRLMFISILSLGIIKLVLAR